MIVIGDMLVATRRGRVAIEFAATLVSFDRDFARFERLRWVLPGQK